MTATNEKIALALTALRAALKACQEMRDCKDYLNTVSSEDYLSFTELVGEIQEAVE